MLSVIECITFILQDTLNVTLNYSRSWFDWGKIWKIYSGHLGLWWGSL